MKLYFNTLLEQAGIDPADVRLLRHHKVYQGGRTPYSLWRDDRPEFERYQSSQPVGRKAYFNSPYWASFVVPPDGSTLFAGLYKISGYEPVAPDWVDPLARQTSAQIGKDLNIYRFERLSEFEPLATRLKVEWGGGARQWVQRAAGKSGNKVIVELVREFREPDFPGYTRFIRSLGDLHGIPRSWAVTLSAARGVYLLTCPRTHEQYVGSAYGADGFWGRWQSYVATGHGGNVALRSRDPSDYQVSILEMAGSAATPEEIIKLEDLWKQKLQSREMGLNRN
jgi:hypothetical protein